MEYISCQRCHAVCRTRKNPTRLIERDGRTLEEASETITHVDGTKTRRVYGLIDHETQAIVDMSLLGD